MSYVVPAPWSVDALPLIFMQVRVMRAFSFFSFAKRMLAVCEPTRQHLVTVHIRSSIIIIRIVELDRWHWRRCRLVSVTGEVKFVGAPRWQASAGHACRLPDICVKHDGVGVSARTRARSMWAWHLC